jgi:Flp pilus assembly protein TadD
MIAFEPPEYADLVHQGNELMEQKQYRDAVAKYAQAIQMSPSSTVAIYDMGLALDKLCDPQAEQFYRIAANMGDSNASYNLAYWYYRFNHKANALRYFRHHLRIADHDDHTHYAEKWSRSWSNSSRIRWRLSGVIHFPSGDGRVSNGQDN